MILEITICVVVYLLTGYFMCIGFARYGTGLILREQGYAAAVLLIWPVFVIMGIAHVIGGALVSSLRKFEKK